jgi:quercetin dioxygenase-like cupin family protein
MQETTDMTLPDFIHAFPALDLPLPDSSVSSSALRTDDGLAVFFTFHEDVELPPHSHKAQWGTVIRGELELTRDGETRSFGPGESYFIPADVVHSARVAAGSVVLDVFEEADRYPIRA